MRFKVSTFHPDTARVSTRTVAAEDHASVETRLKAEGVMVLSVEPIENKLARSLQSRRRKVDAGLVCIELGGLLRAGLTVSEALDSLAHRDDHPNVGVYRQLYDGLLSGLPLSESMKQVEGSSRASSLPRSRPTSARGGFRTRSTNTQSTRRHRRRCARRWSAPPSIRQP